MEYHAVTSASWWRLVYWGLREMVDRPLGMERLPLWRASWGPWNMLSKSLQCASVSIGAPLFGNMVGCCFHRAFEIKRYIKRYIKMSCKQVTLPIGALLANLEGICLPGLFGLKTI
jgi:hypothetical protein